MRVQSAVKLPVNAFVVVCCLIWMEFFGSVSLAVATTILALFLINRDKRVLHPSNMLFLFSTLYLIIPVLIFYLFEFVHWEYKLPWGMVSDWSAVSYDSMRLILMTFCVSFFSLIFLSRRKKEKLRRHRDSGIYIPLNVCIIFLILNIVGILLFMYLTGGVGAWITDYSNVYISGKEGVGWLNFLMINLAHFTFFICGFTFFSSYHIPRSKKIYFLALLVITFCMVCFA